MTRAYQTLQRYGRPWTESRTGWCCSPLTSCFSTGMIGAKAKLLIGQHSYSKHGKAAKLAIVVETKPLKAKTKVHVGKVTEAKVVASLGGKADQAYSHI